MEINFKLRVYFFILTFYLFLPTVFSFSYGMRGTLFPFLEMKTLYHIHNIGKDYARATHFLNLFSI